MMTTKELKVLLQTYFDLTSCGLDALQKIHPQNQDEEVYHAILTGFFSSLNDYVLLVYDDLYSSISPMFPKSNVNKVLIRNAVEATLLLDIFVSSPHLIERYYQTYISDEKRFESLLSGLDTNDKYLKRFAWLPRLKGRRANTLVDLLNYVNFTDEQQKEYYLILIRNLDNFTHPSFHIGQSIDNHSIKEIDAIGALFLPQGIVFELCSNLIDFLQKINYCTDIISDLSNCLSLSYQPSNDIIHVYDTKIKNAPEEINPICYVIAQLSNILSRPKDLTYQQRNLRYLLLDLAPRYDDLLKSYFNKDTLLFEVQIRTIVESLSLIHTLLKEDEERNRIFFIHQQIKGYEANKTALELYTLLGQKAPDIDINSIYTDNITLIKEYYKEHHQKEVEQREILRLNGWALYLKGINNKTVPNAAFFVNSLLEAYYRDPIKHLLATFVEMSNAYTHITLSAFRDQKHPIDSEIPTAINYLLENIILGIYHALELNNLVNDEEKKEIESYFPSLIASLNTRFINK